MPAASAPRALRAGEPPSQLQAPPPLPSTLLLPHPHPCSRSAGPVCTPTHMFTHTVCTPDCTRLSPASQSLGRATVSHLSPESFLPTLTAGQWACWGRRLRHLDHASGRQARGDWSNWMQGGPHALKSLIRSFHSYLLHLPHAGPSSPTLAGLGWGGEGQRLSQEGALGGQARRPVARGSRHALPTVKAYLGNSLGSGTGALGSHTWIWHTPPTHSKASAQLPSSLLSSLPGSPSWPTWEGTSADPV